MESAVLVAVAGKAGAGKGRLASRLASRLGARRVEVLARVGGCPQASEYADAIEAARTSLSAGETVVMIGPFHTRESRRELMRLASDTRSALLYVECSANESVRRRRLRLRLEGEIAAGAIEVDAWIGRLVGQDPGFERVGSEIPRAAQMLVDTTVGIDIWAGLAASRVEAWFAGTLRPGVEDGQAISAG